MFGRWGGTMKKDYEDFLNKLTPIELPTDEEIKKEALDRHTKFNSFIVRFKFFNEGAKWVIEQIKKKK